ncbi:hypothetical protein L596_015315 [Steinernema carpocapsae]|uniref:Uncharacterized protein n=1 Tax=Steinernema carpocapsae TaxID=34508 RepID=A0A4U5NEU2_STECR|nr:hypothetical protein L596_015315 [Steinernema carpocapsae]
MFDLFGPKFSRFMTLFGCFPPKFIDQANIFWTIQVYSRVNKPVTTESTLALQKKSINQSGAFQKPRNER